MVDLNKYNRNEVISKFYKINKEESKILFTNDLKKINKKTRSEIKDFTQKTYISNKISQNNLKNIPDKGYPINYDDIDINPKIPQVKQKTEEPKNTTKNLEITL